MPAAQRGESAAKPRARADTRGSKAGPRRALAPKHILMIAAGVLALGGAGVLATGNRGEHIAQAVGRGVDRQFGHAGFALGSVQVQGASPMATADIVRAAQVYKDQPLLGLDLQEVRRRVEGVGWVKQASIVRLLPDTLVISVKERRQLAVWQHAGKSLVIDEHGKPIPEADPARFASLPLVVGAGGADHAGEILPVLAQRPKLMRRMEALIRVDDRRWDLRLKDGSLIQLPAFGEEDALAQLEQLDLRSRILDTGFDRIDLRNPDVVAVRPRAPAAPGDLAAAGV